MKKILKSFALAVLSLSCVQAVPVLADVEYSFSDIGDAKYSWAVGYIEDMAEAGFISGYTDGTYRPDNDVTRIEAFSLFARAMGSRSDVNKPALDAAVEKYSKILKKYEFNFGSEDIAYLLYRGAIKESELDTYFKGELKSEPMPRHEAAIVMTKALCAEEEATSEIMVDFEYKDAKKIPAKSSQYVYYVTENGLMSGVGEGLFAPDTNVTRSQVAVMLSKTVDQMEYNVEELKFDAIEGKNVGFYDENNEYGIMGFNNTTRFYVDGDLIQAKDVPSGVKALFTYVKNELVYVDVSSNTAEIEVSGIYQNFVSNSGVVSVNVKTDDEVNAYDLGKGIVITRDGENSSVRDLEKGDFVNLVIVDGYVQTIAAEQKESTITRVTIEENSVVEDGTITISHATDEYNGAKLEVSDKVKVTKNDLDASLSDIYAGDTAVLTLEYGVVTKIKAESIMKTVDGTIKVIEISASPKITVTSKGKDNVYDVTPDVNIIVNQKEASLYDFRVGDQVSLTIESKAVKKITALSAASTAYSKTGTVTAINTSYGFIKISYTDGGATYEETVYCKDSTTKFITSEAVPKTLKDIKQGDMVSVRGTLTNGAFVASLVLLEVE